MVNLDGELFFVFPLWMVVLFVICLLAIGVCIGIGYMSLIDTGLSSARAAIKMAGHLLVISAAVIAPHCLYHYIKSCL